MKYINELREGEIVHEIYYCKQRQSMTSPKTGKNYLNLTLSDKTGTVNAKVWDLNRDIHAFEEGNFINITAEVRSYNKIMQLSVTSIKRAQEGDYDEKDYIATTKQDVGEMYDYVLSVIASIKDKYIKKLLQDTFSNKKLEEKFKKHTAAKTMHHNYMGGLLEHTVSVTKICSFLADHYENVNKDLLIACALLHDICKIRELSELPSTDYTDEGELLGHIVMGSEFIGKQADKIEGFPHELKILMQHCILAHHGEYEFGSPKLPKTIEAYLLHCADDMDAKMKMYQESVETLPTGVKWTDFNRVLSTRIRSSNYQ
ncbi:MAG: HD domain-containing protein [Firmicutes bacterium]|nr:HD domain-containing protein [Bacillota bacterium]